MNKNIIKTISLTLILICMLTGCSSSEKIDISSLEDSYSPDINLENINDIVINKRDSEIMMYKFNIYSRYGYMDSDLDKYLQTNIYNSTNESIIQNNINKLYNSLDFLVSLNNQSILVNYEKEAIKTIQDYIEYSRNNKDIEVSISEELSKSNSKNLIKEYINENNIVITDIKYADKLNDIDYSSLPIKCEYNYTILGYIQNGKEQIPFEKEFKQDFYINLNDEYLEKNNNEKKDIKLILEGIVPFGYEAKVTSQIKQESK